MTPITDVQVAAELEEFLHAQFPATTSGGIGRDIDLFDTGVVDSVGVAETLAHIEERYRVEIPDEILLSDDFTTIDSMAKTIVGLMAGSTLTT
jgi:acyl carrier protein